MSIGPKNNKRNKKKKSKPLTQIGEGFFIGLNFVSKESDIYDKTESLTQNPNVIFDYENVILDYGHISKNPTDFKKLKLFFGSTVSSGDVITIIDAEYLKEQTGDSNIYDIGGTYTFIDFDEDSLIVILKSVSVNNRSQTYDRYEKNYFINGSLKWTTTSNTDETKTETINEIVNKLGWKSNNSFFNIFRGIKSNDILEIKTDKVNIEAYTIIQYYKDDDGIEHIEVKEELPSDKNLFGEKVFCILKRIPEDKKLNTSDNKVRFSSNKVPKMFSKVQEVQRKSSKSRQNKRTTSSLIETLDPTSMGNFSPTEEGPCFCELPTNDDGVPIGEGRKYQEFMKDCLTRYENDPNTYCLTDTYYDNSKCEHSGNVCLYKCEMMGMCRCFERGTGPAGDKLVFSSSDIFKGKCRIKEEERKSPEQKSIKEIRQDFKLERLKRNKTNTNSMKVPPKPASESKLEKALNDWRMSGKKVFNVEVRSNNGRPKFAIDGILAPVLPMKRGITYKFLQSHISNGIKGLSGRKFILTFSGIEESNMVRSHAEPGTRNSYVYVTIPVSTPTTGSAVQVSYTCQNNNAIGNIISLS